MVMVLARSKRKDSASDAFWGRLINDEGKGTQLMWRLADAVFFHMQAQTRVWHGIDASQLFWLLRTAALEDDETIDARVLNLSRYLDDAGVHHTPVIVNGQQVPTMDRTSWFQLMCHEARATPNYAHKWWNNLFLALPLQDPHTRRPFPSAPPRWAFPGSPDPSPASSMEDTQLHHSKKKSKSKTLQPESHEPDYVFLPRIKTESSTTNNKNNDDDKKTKEKSRLHKVPNFRFFGGDKGRLSKDHRPKDPPVTFVADGRIHKAHARSASTSGSETPLPPRPNTATGHYEIPRTLSPSPQRQWPDTRGIPGLVRSNRHVGPPPSSFTPIRGASGASSPRSGSRTPTSLSRPRTPVRTEDLLVPLAPEPDAVDISTQFGPGGEAMQAVVDRALLQVQQPPTMMRRPIQRRHSSAAILTPLAEKTEAEVQAQAVRVGA